MHSRGRWVSEQLPSLDLSFCAADLQRSRHQQDSTAPGHRTSESLGYQTVRMAQSANDEIRVPEALGVVKDGNDRRRYTEHPHLIWARHFHWKRLRLRVFQRQHAQDFLRFGMIITACARAAIDRPVMAIRSAVS